MPPKALSAVVAVVLLLMMTVGAAGLAYVFISGLQKSGEESAQGQLSSMQEAISSCMTIDSVYSNKVYLRNCGDGIIDNASLKVYMDDEPISLSMSPSKISKDDVGTVSLYGIYDLAPYTNHNLKIQNDATSVSKRVKAEPRKDDLVGGWDFDDGSGTSARDWSGKGNGGTLKNATGTSQCGTNGACPDWVNGKLGNALNFDGVGDYVEAPTSGYNLENALTISFWVKLNSFPTGNSAGVGQAGYNKWVFINTGGYPGFNVQSAAAPWPSVNSANKLSTGVWYNLIGAFAQNGPNMVGNLYINGAFDSTFTVVNTPVNTMGNPVRMGITVHMPAGSGYINGIIDDVRIYNKALTPDELVNLKAA